MWFVPADSLADLSLVAGNQVARLKRRGVKARAPHSSSVVAGNQNRGEKPIVFNRISKE